MSWTQLVPRLLAQSCLLLLGAHLAGCGGDDERPPSVLQISEPATLMDAGQGDVFRFVDFYPDEHDRAAVAFGGLGFMVLGKRYMGEEFGAREQRQVQRIGFLLPDGAAPRSFDIGSPAPAHTRDEMQALAFGGGVYLAVFEQRNPPASATDTLPRPSIIAQRIDPSGAVLDAEPIQLVEPAYPPRTPKRVTRRPQVGYGEGTFLVVYHADGGDPSVFQPFPPSFIEGRLVTPGGRAGARFRVSPNAGYRGDVPRVVFDGAQFIVAVGNAGGIRLFRVTASGSVLNPEGFALPEVEGCLLTGDFNLASNGRDEVLFVWASLDKVCARRYSSELVLLGEQIVVARTGAVVSQPAAAFSASEFWTTWAERREVDRGSPSAQNSSAAHIARLAANGDVIEGPNPAQGGFGEGPFSLRVSQVPPLSTNVPYPFVSGAFLPAIVARRNQALIVYPYGIATQSSPPQEKALYSVWVQPAPN